MLGVKAVNGFAKASNFVGGLLRKGVEKTASKVKSYIDDVKKANESGSKDA